MPAERLSMRKIREILRLRWGQKMAARDVGASVHVSPSTVLEYERRAVEAGLSWPLPGEASDDELERRLYPAPVPARVARPWPEWADVHRELRRKHVTLQLLWEEYRASHPDGYGYSQFCKSYADWAKNVDVCMRQTHKAGDKTFVDFAGDTLEIVDGGTGEVTPGYLFLGVLGASSYTFGAVCGSQDLANWTRLHVEMFEFFEGVTAALVPDNTKTAVRSPCFYDPDINRTYLDLAEHYGVAVLPARVRRPRDKAKVESAVLHAERFVLGRLRNQCFFTVAEANGAVQALVQELNERPFQKMPGSRRSVYQEVDRPALHALPASRWVFAEWSAPLVHIDYHVDVDGHYYSVPYTLRGERLDARRTALTVELFLRGVRVASHLRSHAKGRHTTLPEHMPPSHRAYSEWSPSRFASWAQKIGPATTAMVEKVLVSRRHVEQGYRDCLGILRLGTQYGEERLEAACRRGLHFRLHGYAHVRSILRRGLDAQPLAAPTAARPPIVHENIRGSQYYGEASDRRSPEPTGASSRTAPPKAPEPPSAPSTAVPPESPEAASAPSGRGGAGPQQLPLMPPASRAGQRRPPC